MQINYPQRGKHQHLYPSIKQKLLNQQYYINTMSYLQSETNSIHQPLLNNKLDKQEKPFPKLLNKRKSRVILNLQSSVASKNNPFFYQDPAELPTQDVSQMPVNSADDLIREANQPNAKKNLNSSIKKSIKVQFNKKRKEQEIQKPKEAQSSKGLSLNNRQPISQSIYQKFELQGLRIKTNWAIPSKNKFKSFNSQIMSLQPRIQYFLYYMNLMLNTVFRLALLAILVLMIVYEQQYKLMQMIVSMQIVAVFLYSLAMVKMLYTKKDEESIYFQKHFSERDITDIEMDRVLRKHFTWKNILMNVSAYFKLNSKFKTDIKISILRQQIFKRMETVLCFIPFTVIFFTTPTIFRFQCDYPVELIVTATICLEFVRMTVHYIVIFIEN